MLAFTFPGQGSQRPGMGKPWEDHPSWELVADAAAATGRDLAHLLLAADAEELTATRNAQLATFAMSLVVLDAVERLGLEPTACAGHSLGEYTALVASGSLGFEEGVTLVAERGESMQAAADDQPGTMAAVLGLNDDDVEVACRRADDDVWVANYNADGQVVVAGSAEAITKAEVFCKELGAKRVMRFPVGGAFHTPYMAPARQRLRKALAQSTFRDPEIPVVANVDAKSHPHGPDWPSLLSAQLCSPVRWRYCLEELAELGCTTFVELGAGGVLTGLVRRTLPSATALGVASPEDLDKLVEIVGGDPVATYHSVNQGEHLYVSERLVISPTTGLFQPTVTADQATKEGELVDVGRLLGTVGDTEVRSAFAGWLMGMLAIPGERVTAGQPIAWLRSV